MNEGMNKGTGRYTHISMFKESLRSQFQVAWKVCTVTPQFPKAVNYVTLSLSLVCLCSYIHVVVSMEVRGQLERGSSLLLGESWIGFMSSVLAASSFPH